MQCLFDESIHSAYFDGELTGEELATFEGHLAECSACTVKLDELKVLRGAARTMAGLLPGDAFFERLKERIETATTKPGPFVSFGRAVLATAACAVLVVVILFILTPGPDAAAPFTEPAAFDLADQIELLGIAETIEDTVDDVDDFSLEHSLQRVFDSGDEDLGRMAGAW